MHPNITRGVVPVVRPFDFILFFWRIETIKLRFIKLIFNELTVRKLFVCAVKKLLIFELTIEEMGSDNDEDFF